MVSRVGLRRLLLALSAGKLASIALAWGIVSFFGVFFLAVQFFVASGLAGRVLVVGWGLTQLVSVVLFLEPVFARKKLGFVWGINLLIYIAFWVMMLSVLFSSPCC